MKKKIIIVLILVIIIMFIFFIVPEKIKNGSEEEIASLPITYVTENEENTIQEDENKNPDEDQEKIEQIIENQGFEGNTSMYEIAEEYDGRESLTVKPWIQYQIALTGIIKKEKPEFEEMNELLKKAPNHTGIWISENSREQFIKILNNIANGKYTINKDGYLKQQEKESTNEYDTKISQMLTSNNLFAFDINSVSYLVDEVTGQIQEYPFEEMDPYTQFEYFESENKQLFVISKNNSGKISQEDALKEILENVVEK